MRLQQDWRGFREGVRDREGGVRAGEVEHAEGDGKERDRTVGVWIWKDKVGSASPGLGERRVVVSIGQGANSRQ
jgi:hypothetical protein